MVKYIRFTYIKINLTINSFRHCLKLAGNIEWWIKHFAFMKLQRERETDVIMTIDIYDVIIIVVATTKKKDGEECKFDYFTVINYK